MASGIQQGIASKYYAMADQARTPDQINQVRQLLAKTIQSGGLPAYEGIPIVEQLNGKYQTALQQQAMAGQTQAGLIPPSSQPMAQEILAQAQQSEEDNGIDELPSNLPTEEYAGGGIVGLAGGGVSPSLLQPGFGELFSGPVNEMNRNPNKPYSLEEIQKNLREGKAAEAARNAHKIGPPAPAAPSISISEIMKKFRGSSDANVFPNMPNTGSIADLNYYNELQTELKKDPSNETFKTEINKLLNKNPKLGSQSLQLTPSKFGTNPYDVEDAQLGIMQKGPAELPSNVQALLDKYKTSKKEGDTNINKLAAPSAPATSKKAAAPVVKEEMGPPKDLMAAEPTAPKEDAISKYEKMFTQAPEQRQKERDLDFYTRLFQAGIGVASGSSRNALENLKEAQPAIAGFASDISKQREEDRNRIKDLAALGLKREEFALELKKLGISEKQVNAISKHYEDYYNLGKERNRILGINASNSAGNVNARLESAQSIAANRMAKDLYNASLRADPYHAQSTDAQKWASAQQRAGLSGGPNMAGPTPITWNNLIAPTK